MLTPVPSKPHTSLGRVLEALGDVLLEPVAVGRDTRRHLGGVVIHDPHDDAEFPAQAVVLGVGVRESDEIVQLVHAVAARGAAALVVRSPVAASTELVRAANSSGVALLGLASGASWAQLAAMLRTLLAEGDVGDVSPQTLGGMPSGDLFALANAVAALLDAPVTIEDRSSRVLAFSGRQDEADTARVETVLGRQVPQRYFRLLTEYGVFRELYRTDNPVLVPPLPSTEEDFTIPRVAVAVRAGDEILGSIWAAVRDPLSAERSQALRDAAKLVALHMLRIRAGADVERRLRADLVSTALEGGAGARAALDRLGLADQPVVVLALGIIASDTLDESLVGQADESLVSQAGLAGERQRLADAFAMHLGAVHPRAAAALVGDVAYGLVPVRRDRSDGEERAVRIGTHFLERIGDRVTASIGVGPVVADAAQLPNARAGADRALRVLRTGRGSSRVARLADVHVDTLLLELRDLIEARGDEPTGPIARLVAYDRRHNTDLVETLRAWLDAFGDVAAAAAAVYVHPNTFRYRLRRLAEVGELDLDDPDARFAAMLQLRVIPTSTR